jgi:hypothetical protein
MFSVDFWVTFGFSVRMCLLHDWARLTLVDLFTHAFNFASTLYQKLDRNSASEHSVAPRDAINTAKDDPLCSDDLEHEEFHSTNHLFCGSMDMPPAIVPHGEKLSVDLLNSKVHTQPYCSPKGTNPEGTHSDLDANVELAASCSEAEIDQSSAAFEAAVDAALEKKFSSLEACLEARFQAYIDARLDGLSGVYVTSAVFEAKLSAFDAFVRSGFAELGKWLYTLAKEHHLAVKNVSRLANALGLVSSSVGAMAGIIHSVSDRVERGSVLIKDFRDKQCEAMVQFDTDIQNIFATIQRIETKPSEVQDDSQEDLRDFSAVSQRVGEASSAVVRKIMELYAKGSALDEQAWIKSSERMVETGIKLVEDAHPLRLQWSTTRLNIVADEMEEAVLILDQ